MAAPQDRKTAKFLVDTWKRTGDELDRIKWEELRAMTEDDAARGFELLKMHPRDGWLAPERLENSGLVEQQKIFRRAR